MVLEEYKRSLKMPEAEELFDLVIYRPIAFIVVKLLYRLPITPNQVTMLSLISGIIASWYFAVGKFAALAWAACWYAVANILDCSDGQLARLQHSGTLLGRVVDGVADYVVSIAIFVGIGIGLQTNEDSMWLLVVLAGVSSALHALFFDYYQSEYISTVRGEKNFLEKEEEQFTKELRRIQAVHRSGLKSLALRIYLSYLGIQKKSNTKSESMSFEPDAYRRANRGMIRCWSVLGPTTNRTLLIVCALFRRLDLYLLAVLAAGNLWLLFCYARQRKIHQELERTLVVQTIR